LRRAVQLRLEPLEERMVLSGPQVINVPAGDVPALINAINQGNASQTGAIINLAQSTYNVTQIYVSSTSGVNGFMFGPTGLPPITNTITINGNGAIIQRSLTSAQDFRLFMVSGGSAVSGNVPAMTEGDLTLNNVQIQGGFEQGGNGTAGGGGGLGAGGAIFNMGILNLNNDTFDNNKAVGGSSLGGAGGGGGGMGGGSGSAVNNGNADSTGDGGGMGGPLIGIAFPNLPLGGLGVVNGNGAGGSGAGFNQGGMNAKGVPGAAGGGNSALATFNGDGGDGGFGVVGGTKLNGGDGGQFGSGGTIFTPFDAGGGGGGVGGGGSVGFSAGGDGGFGGGGASTGGAIISNGQASGFYGGYGGFGGGGGQGFSATVPNETGLGGFGGGDNGGGGAGMGGAIFSMFGTVTIVNSTFNGNNVTGGAGAPKLTSDAGGNGGDAFGGAIFNLDGNVNMTFVSISGNTATGGTAGAGGGLAGKADGAGFYTLAFGNNLGGTGGTVANVVLINSIIGQNTGSGNGAVPSVDMVNDASDSRFTNTAQVLGNTNLIPTAAMHNGDGITILNPSVVANNFSMPNLGPLQNNGGLTPTLAVTPNSPAKGAANPSLGGLPTTDQRGFPRGKTPGLVDLGAYQSQNTVTTLSGMSSAYSPTTGTTITLSSTTTKVGGGVVSSGSVVFQFGNNVQTASINSQGQAGALFTFPPSVLPGPYFISATYNDTAIPAVLASSVATGTLVIPGEATHTTITSTNTQYQLFNQLDTITALVTDAAGNPVNGGTVTLTDGGQFITANVQNGVATAVFNFSLFNEIPGAHGVNAFFSGFNFLGASSGSATVPDSTLAYYFQLIFLQMIFGF
jgi:hypothetical protein